MLKVFVVLVVVSSTNPVISWDWCSDAASCTVDGEKVKNTMCTMKQASENENYTQIKEGTDENFRRSMLTWHNTYRNKLANGSMRGWPTAADMRQLTYDKELETVALRWSFQTTRGHDKCRRTEKYEKVGQNCGMLWNKPGFPLLNVSTTFKNWVDERLIASPSIVDKYKFDLKIGHYTAIVWASTYKIGCAVVHFQPKVGGKAPYSDKQGLHVSCNLAPLGNIELTKMYTRGEPCTACPQGTACNPKSSHPYLCANPGDPANEVPDFIGARGSSNVGNYYWTMTVMIFGFATPSY